MRKMYSSWTPLLAALLLAAGAAAPLAGQQSPDAPAPLVVGTKEAPPFAVKGEDGRWRGIAIELWEGIAEELGVEYQLREPVNRALLRRVDEAAWQEVLDRYLGR